MRYISRLLVVIGFSCVVFITHAYGAIPNDVKGWGNTHWGMTPDEAKKILGNQWNVSGDQVLKIESYEVLGYKSVARLDFRDNNRLSKVVILIGETGEHISADDAHTALNKLRESLTSQYGEGQIIRDFKEGAYTKPGLKSSGQEQVVIQWTFPSSIINLDYTFAGALSMFGIVQEKHLTIFIKYKKNTTGE